MNGARVRLVTVTATAAQVAEDFWSLGSDEQADFFAELDEIAGYRLCFQMAHVMVEIAARAGRGSHAAQNGLQTMLSHANGYHEAAAESRCWDAKRALNDMAVAAKQAAP